MPKLAGKIALITGGTTGIGFATARLFRDEGATVIITGANAENIAQAQTALGIDCVRCDARSLSDADDLMAGIKARHGRLDVLFLNAGIGSIRPIEDVDEDYFDVTFGVNVRGLYFTMQKALPLMSAGGSIILNASVSAHLGPVQGSIYAASKAAVRSLGRSLAAELAPRKIRVNTVSPGPVDTPIMTKMGPMTDEIARAIGGAVPMGRIGQPEELAKAVLFLASDDSSYMTAAEMVVSGGLGDI